MGNLQIYGFTNNSIYALEAQGLARVMQAYANNCAGEDIVQIGFNNNSGYVYIALENGVQIASKLGDDVEYITINTEEGQESFFDSYELALDNM